MGRVRGDVALDARSDQGKDSDDDGLEPDDVTLGEAADEAASDAHIGKTAEGAGD